ncbi:MAG TPA: DNA-binding protein [Thermoanaerobaculia bacterium]|nr:DNA-binding protein [Thermoanaerobaculia bacterium]
MTRSKTSIALALLAFLASAVAYAQPISIADARSAPAGTVVTVEGSVTVPSGRYSSSTFDQGFAVEDGTAGIYVSTAFNSGLRLWKRVRVTGEVGDDGFGQLVLRPAATTDVVALHGAQPVFAEDVATGDVGEGTEGSLVAVEGTITRPIVNDLPYGYQVFIDDGSGETQVFIAASTGINPFSIPFVKPGRRIRAIGLSGQFLAQNEVLPRFRSDLRPAH